MNKLKIGEFARIAGVATSTIRYYERRGLLPEAYRERAAPHQTGYRMYSLDMLARVKFIKSSQHLGFTLTEISNFLELVESRDITTQELVQRIKWKKTTISKEIAQLEEKALLLSELLIACKQMNPKEVLSVEELIRFEI